MPDRNELRVSNNPIKSLAGGFPPSQEIYSAEGRCQFISLRYRRVQIDGSNPFPPHPEARDCFNKDTPTVRGLKPGCLRHVPKGTHYRFREPRISIDSTGLRWTR